MIAERTPQELFKLMLDNWDNFNTEFICSRISIMLGDNYISLVEYELMNKFLFNHRDIAIKNFGATVYFSWWNCKEQKKRKQFVKYLSEIK